MGEINGTRTEKNLLAAFAGESQARNRYEFFAKQAKKEGFVQVSRVFEELAGHERSHAKSFFKLLDGSELELTGTFCSTGIRSTVENLRDSVRGEQHEHANLYPEFARVAREEGLQEVAVLFAAIAVAEGYHRERLEEQLRMVEDGSAFRGDVKTRWVCSKCGYIFDGE